MTSSRYTYDLNGVDLTDCYDVALMPVPKKAIPAIMGTLEALSWEARHVDSTSWEIGVQLYALLQEVFLVNDCIVAVLEQIRDCVCAATSGGASDTLSDDIAVIAAVDGNTKADFSGDPIVIASPGAEPTGYDPGRCLKVQSVFDGPYSIAVDVVSLSTGGIAVSAPALLGLLAWWLVIPLPITILTSAMISLAAVVFDVGMDGQLAAWYAIRDTVICEMYRAASIEAMHNIVLSYIGATVTEPTATLLKIFYNTSFMSNLYDSGSQTSGYDPGHCLTCQSFEYDDLWYGYPCPGDKDLLGTCGDNRTTVSVANPVNTPNFTLPGPGNYNIKVHVWYEGVTGGEIYARLYRESSPPGLAQERTLEVNVGASETWINTFTSQPAGEYRIELIDAPVGATAIRVNTVATRYTLL